MNTWHERLRFARMQAGLKAGKVASMIGVSSATYSDWESGEIKKIEGENLLKVCDVLGVNPHWLLFGKGVMCPADVPYPSDPKAAQVVMAMEKMSEYKKDLMLAATQSLSGLNDPTQ